MYRIKNPVWTAVGTLALAVLVLTPAASADQVIADDLIVQGSACIGLDCNNGESFGFETIRLKENNLRIRAQDTSTSASFPTVDWQITFNDSSNGGANKFSIDDLDAGRTPFTIEASAPSHSLYVDDGGRIGFGTSTPVVELHVKDGDTPTLRLEQDGSSGFTPQTWDVAGNETNFFVRDVTNGSNLSFRIRPSAPANSIFVDTDGDVGLGTASPSERLHVVKSVNGGETKIRIENLADGGNAWQFSVSDGGSSLTEQDFRISKAGTGAPEVTVRARQDANNGSATLFVDGSVEATNVTFTSARDKKTDFQPVDTRAILDKVVSLEMTSWRYKSGSPGRHIGPIAEDFDAAFGLGDGGREISVVDANGVALAAIQALAEENRELRQLLADLEVAISTSAPQD